MNELGEYLKGERLRRQLDLNTISKRTCISLSMLTALEEGDSVTLGTPLLVRSFTRAYCGVLGVEPLPVLEKYAGETPRHERLDEGIRKFRERSLATRRKRKLGLYVLLLMILGATGVYISSFWPLVRQDSKLSQFQQMARNNQTVPEDVVANVTTEKTEVGQPGRSPSGAIDPRISATDKKPGSEQVTGVLDPSKWPRHESTSSEPAAPTGQEKQGHRVLIEAIKATWVKVQPDSKKVENLLLQPGEIREWAVQEKLRLVIGNATGAKVSWDGKPLGNLGKAGSTVRLNLPEDLIRR
jgi:cytoskeleton protein RodZ